MALQVCNRANRQTKKLNVFGHPGGGWNPNPTKLGMVVEDLEHVLAPLKLLGVWCIVSPLRGTENMGETIPLNLKLHNASSKSNQILTANASWNAVQTLQILWKSRKRYAPVGRLYSTFWSNLSKNFSFCGPTPCHCTDGGEIWHGGGDLRAKFHPHGCKRYAPAGVYIPHFDQMSVKISVLGVLYRNRCTDGGAIWHGGGGVPSSMPHFSPIVATRKEGPLLYAKFHPHWCHVSPL